MGRSSRTSRSELRRRTEQRILAAARRQFAQRGYAATTIRAIAAEAVTDPGLVMRYFGSKADLFAATADLAIDPAPSPGENLIESVLNGLAAKLEQEPASLLAGLRSLLAHPSAGRVVAESMVAQQRAVAAQLAGDDAGLRAGLIGALTVGAVMARYVLELDGVRDAPPEQVLELLAPCVEHLAGR